jgi:hypothetical protein
MSASTISFIAWGAVMLAILVGMFVATRRSKGVQDEAEDVASKALPEIGQIAEKKHVERFGRAPTNAPGSTGSWYPEAKGKVAKGSVR